MTIMRVGVAAALVGLMAGCAMEKQTPASAPLPSLPSQVNMTNDPAHRWGEPVIAVNPKNPNNLVAAINFSYVCKTANEQACQQVQLKSGRAAPYGLANNVPTFSGVRALVSSDGGTSWSIVSLPATPQGHPDLMMSGHPTATVTADGTFYIAYNAIHFADMPTMPVSHGGIAVTRSTDGGKTWSPAVLAGTPLDHPYITSDLATGKVYVSSGTPGELGPVSMGDPNAKPSAIKDRWVVSSSDGIHWSTPQPFGGYSGGGAGSAAANFIPFVSVANGVLAVAFRSTNQQTCGTGASVPCTVFETTTDAGAHWTRGTFPAPTAYDGGTIMAADPAKPGHFSIAVLMNNDTEFDVYQTRDSGKTWSGPTKISEDPGKVHLHGWMTYSPAGVLGLMWKTRDEAPPPAAPTGNPPPSRAPYNVWAAISRDGGATFSAPLKVTAAASPGPQPGVFATDSLSSIAVGPHAAYVTWGDWRSGDLSSFFSAIDLNAFKAPH